MHKELKILTLSDSFFTVKNPNANAPRTFISSDLPGVFRTTFKHAHNYETRKKDDNAMLTKKNFTAWSINLCKTLK